MIPEHFIWLRIFMDLKWTFQHFPKKEIKNEIFFYNNECAL